METAGTGLSDRSLSLSSPEEILGKAGAAKMTEIKRWRTVRSSIPFRTPWFSVRQDDCVIDGAGETPFYIIDSADWVCVVAITARDELVLVRQYRHGWSDITLELPAGEVHEGEDVIAAAQRELAEETGYMGGAAKVIGVTSPNPARYGNKLHIVAIQGPEKLAAPKNDPEEHTEPVTWPMNACRDLFRSPEFANSSQAGALAVALVAMGAL